MLFFFSFPLFQVETIFNEIIRCCCVSMVTFLFSSLFKLFPFDYSPFGKRIPFVCDFFCVRLITTTTTTFTFFGFNRQWTKCTRCTWTFFPLDLNFDWPLYGKIDISKCGVMDHHNDGMCVWLKWLKKEKKVCSYLNGQNREDISCIYWEGHIKFYRFESWDFTIRRNSRKKEKKEGFYL